MVNKRMKYKENVLQNVVWNTSEDVYLQGTDLIFMSLDTGRAVAYPEINLMCDEFKIYIKVHEESQYTDKYVPKSFINVQFRYINGSVFKGTYPIIGDIITVNPEVDEMGEVNSDFEQYPITDFKVTIESTELLHLTDYKIYKSTRDVIVEKEGGITQDADGNYNIGDDVTGNTGTGDTGEGSPAIVSGEFDVWLSTTKHRSAVITSSNSYASDLSQVSASENSNASGDMSQVNASENSSVYGGVSQVNASRGSTVSVGDMSQVNASRDSNARSKMSQVNASESSNANGYISQVNASENSTVGGRVSQVNASIDSTTGLRGMSQVNASRGSNATGDMSQVNTSENSTAYGDMSQVNASRDSTAYGTTQVNVSNYVQNNAGLSSAWGYATSGEPSTSNIKAQIFSKTGDIKHSGVLNSGHNFTDYAELFPNLTGKEQGYGLLQTVDGYGVRPTNEGEQIIGVTSATAGVILGDAPFTWANRWLTDKWGAYIYHDVDDMSWEPEENQTEEDRPKITVPKENPEWDPNMKQISREDRPDEWTVVGLVGQVYIRLAKDVNVMDYVKAGNNGVGITSNKETNIRVMRITHPYEEDEGYKIGFCILI